MRISTSDTDLWGQSQITIVYDFYVPSSDAICFDGSDTSTTYGSSWWSGDLLPDGQDQITYLGTEGTDYYHIPTSAAGETTAFAVLSLVLTSRLKAPDFGDSYVWLQNLGQGSTFEGSGSGAMLYILELYENGFFYEAKDLADGMNNAEECVDRGTYWGGVDSSMANPLISYFSSLCGYDRTYCGCDYDGECGGEFQWSMRHEYVACGGVMVELTMNDRAFIFPINLFYGGFGSR